MQTVQEERTILTLIWPFDGMFEEVELITIDVAMRHQETYRLI